MHVYYILIADAIQSYANVILVILQDKAQLKSITCLISLNLNKYSKPGKFDSQQNLYF